MSWKFGRRSTPTTLSISSCARRWAFGYSDMASMKDRITEFACVVKVYLVRNIGGKFIRRTVSAPAAYVFPQTLAMTLSSLTLPLTSVYSSRRVVSSDEEDVPAIYLFGSDSNLSMYKLHSWQRTYEFLLRIVVGYPTDVVG